MLLTRCDSSLIIYGLTDIITAWMNSATMTCWMQAHTEKLLKDTKQVSVLKIPPVIMDIIDDMHVQRIHK